MCKINFITTTKSWNYVKPLQQMLQKFIFSIKYNLILS